MQEGGLHQRKAAHLLKLNLQSEKKMKERSRRETVKFKERKRGKEGKGRVDKDFGTISSSLMYLVHTCNPGC